MVTGLNRIHESNKGLNYIKAIIHEPEMFIGTPVVIHKARSTIITIITGILIEALPVYEKGSSPIKIGTCIGWEPKLITAVGIDAYIPNGSGLKVNWDEYMVKRIGNIEFANCYLTNCLLDFRSSIIPLEYGSFYDERNHDNR